METGRFEGAVSLSQLEDAAARALGMVELLGGAEKCLAAIGLSKSHGSAASHETCSKRMTLQKGSSVPLIMLDTPLVHASAAELPSIAVLCQMILEALRKSAAWRTVGTVASAVIL